MADVDLEAVPAPEGVAHRIGAVGVDLPGGAALGAVQVTVIGRGQDVEFLPSVGAVAMTDETQLLQDVQGAVHRRRDGGRVDGPASVHELGAGDVILDAGQHLDHVATLRRPAQTAGAEAILHVLPGSLR